MAGPKNTFLTEERLNAAKRSMTADRVRRKVKDEQEREVEKAKPGAPYYQPRDSDTPGEALARAKGQGKYMMGEVLGSKVDEGVLAPAVRATRNVMAGKRGKEALEDIVGDKNLMRGSSEAGKQAVENYRNAMENQKEYGMKKGGKVKKYNSGGTATSKPEPKKDTMPEWAKNERANRKQDELNKREAEGAAKEVKRNMSTFGLKNGGSASSRADGIAQRGKTRGKIV
jgi:hypothetical protein